MTVQPAGSPVPADRSGRPDMRLSVNGEAHLVQAGASLADVVAEVSPAPTGVAAALNEAVVPRSAWQSTVLADHDRIEILTAVQGG
jgi:sulfur carrier protein